jgi:F-type H+-transporting ATPase subunit c
MDAQSATLFAEGMKYLGAGLATLGIIGAGIGLGSMFGNYFQGALRNPSAAKSQFTNLMIGMALTEALGIFAFVIALLILFN